MATTTSTLTTQQKMANTHQSNSPPYPSSNQTAAQTKQLASQQPLPSSNVSNSSATAPLRDATGSPQTLSSCPNFTSSVKPEPVSSGSSLSSSTKSIPTSSPTSSPTPAPTSTPISTSIVIPVSDSMPISRPTMIPLQPSSTTLPSPEKHRSDLVPFVRPRSSSSSPALRSARRQSGRAGKVVDAALQSTCSVTRSISTCSACERLSAQNMILQRRVARLNNRVQVASETQRTHGQRILRAFYEQKVAELNEEHKRATTHMLNRQKKCFEEELESLEAEARARETALASQLDDERARLGAVKSALERERDIVLERTEEAMDAIQCKLAHLHARSSRLEREKAQLEHSLAEKSLMIDTLATAAAANDAEKRRVDLMVRISDDERARKDRVIDALQSEVSGLRHRLSAEMEINSQLVHSIESIEGKRAQDLAKHDESLTECRLESQKEADKLGRLIASVIQDFANAQSEVSNRSVDDSVDAGRDESTQDETTVDRNV